MSACTLDGRAGGTPAFFIAGPLHIEDYHPLPGLPDGGAGDPHEKEYRKKYFQQLFRLQGELVKLQDWVAQRHAESGKVRDVRPHTDHR